MNLDLSALKKAISLLEEAILYAQNLPQGIHPEIVRDSVIHRFRCGYDLSQKLLWQCICIQDGIKASELKSKRNFLEMCEIKHIISDRKVWFQFDKARNQLMYIFNENYAESVYQTALKFLPSAKLLCQKAGPSLTQSDGCVESAKG